MTRMTLGSPSLRRAMAITAAVSTALTLTACGRGGDSGSGGGGQAAES